MGKYKSRKLLIIILIPSLVIKMIHDPPAQVKLRPSGFQRKSPSANKLLLISQLKTKRIDCFPIWICTLL